MENKTTTLVVTVALASALIAGGATYMVTSFLAQTNTFTNQTEEKEAQDSLGSLDTHGSETNIGEVTAGAIKEDFEGLVNSSYVGISDYLASSVSYTLDASECCGELSKNTAEARLISDTQEYAPYDFMGTSQLAKNIKENITDFAGYKIGVGGSTSAGGYHIFAYKMNSSNEVDKIFISDSSLLDLE